MENKIYRKNIILYQNIHLKKLFDVLYQFSLRKHSAKAVSSGFSDKKSSKLMIYEKTQNFQIFLEF